MTLRTEHGSNEIKNDREREEWLALTLTSTTYQPRHSSPPSRKIRIHRLFRFSGSLARCRFLFWSFSLLAVPPVAPNRYSPCRYTFLCLSYRINRLRDRCPTRGQRLEIDEKNLLDIKGAFVSGKRQLTVTASDVYVQSTH